jgi:hypothetical protein
MKSELQVALMQQGLSGTPLSHLLPAQEMDSGLQRLRALLTLLPVRTWGMMGLRYVQP